MFGSNLRLVPWRNKEEWLQVYHDAYSNDPDRQSKACQTMELWLTMRNDVPPGVECTVNILSALTSKQLELQLPTRQLQLTLSTSILRVINMLCDNARISDKQTMFSIAKLYNIPDWIIMLRHDVSHGSTLPTLSILTSAATFLLAWLKEFYWEPEKSEMKEIILRRSLDDICKDNVNYYLCLYLDLMNLFVAQGNIPFQAIPSDIRMKLEDVNRRRGFYVAIETMPWIRHAKESFVKNVSFEGSKLLIVIRDLLNLLQDYLPVKQTITWQVDYLPFVVSTMVKHCKEYKGVQKAVWEPLVQRLNSLSLMDGVLSNLCDIDDRDWLLELIRAIVKRHKLDKLLTELSICQTLSSKKDTIAAGQLMVRKRLGLPSDCIERTVLSKIFRSVQRKNPDLRQAYCFSSSVQYLVDSCSSMDIIRAVCASPDKHTIEILNYLMDLMKPQLPLSKRTDLTDLVLIKLGEKTLGKLHHNIRVRTLSDLAVPEMSERTSDIENDNLVQEVSSIDNRENSICNNEVKNDEQLLFVRSGWNFSDCPLGVYPWELEGSQYYHKPFSPETPANQYIFPISRLRILNHKAAAKSFKQGN